MDETIDARPAAAEGVRKVVVDILWKVSRSKYQNIEPAAVEGVREVELDISYRIIDISGNRIHRFLVYCYRIEVQSVDSRSISDRKTDIS